MELFNKPYREISGDLIELAREGKFDMIVHGCNCFNTMKAGIALAIGDAFPQARMIDAETVRGDSSKLGNFTISSATSDFDTKFYIVNAYTQYSPGRNFEIDALKSVLKKMKGSFSHIRIGFPLIGCGIGGGHWPNVRRQLKKFADEQKGIQVTAVIYKP